MYVKNMTSDISSQQPNRQLRQRGREIHSQRREAQTTSVALTDGFDAPTTVGPTEWDNTGIEGVEGRDYDISIGGYRDYVNEMEMMLSEQAEISLTQHPAYYNGPTNGSGHRSSESPSYARRQSPGYDEANDVREVTGRRAEVEMVEHRVLEDGPDRTISLWREQVADSAAVEDDMRPIPSSPAHRKAPSGDSRVGHLSASRPAGRSSGSGSASYPKETSKESSGGYERTEYLISYQKPARVTRQLYTPSFNPQPSPSVRRGSNSSLQPHLNLQRSGSTGPTSPVAKKASKNSFERTEYMVSYLHTPPHSQGSERSSSKHRGPHRAQNSPMNPMSPTQTRTYIPIDAMPTGSASRAASNSPVELILTSCEPSLAHLGSHLAALGVTKVEHLRAMARMSEETRDRELRAPALKQGVTVLEWAILMDKLSTL